MGVSTLGTCQYCNSTEIDFKCKDCGTEFCFNHTGSTDYYYCKDHPNIKLNRIQQDIRNGRCQVLEKSRCPTCGSLLEMTSAGNNQFYLHCTNCSWNSRSMSPRIISSSSKSIEREAEKYGLTRKGDICHQRLRRNKGVDFCYNCFTQYLQSKTETTFQELQQKFSIPEKEVMQIIKEMLERNWVEGFLDERTKSFLFLNDRIKVQLVAEIQSHGFVELQDLIDRLSIDAASAIRVMIEIIRTEKLRGTFNKKKTRYYLESGLTQLILDELKNTGRVAHRALAKKFDVPEENIKNYMMNIMKNKLTNAYFADNGNSTVTVEELEREIEAFCLRKGIFLMNSLANQVQVAPELARRTLFSLIQKGVVRGIFTQNHEFMTEEILSEKIKKIARAYRTIPLSDLAKKLAITENRVEEGLATLISRGSIAGYIDMNKKTFIADETQPITKFGNFASPNAGASPAAGSVPSQLGEVEVVRQYDFVGGQLHFKVVVRNKTNMAIHDIKVILDVPSSYRRTRELITISVIDPGNTHGVDFYLEPAECGISTIGGTVLYKDAMGKTNTIYIQPKDVQIKCPLVIKTLDTIEDCQKAIQSLPSDARAFLISDLPPQMAYSAAHRAVSQFDTRNVASLEDDSTGKYEAEAWFSSEAKVTGGRIITRIYINGANSTLEIRVWCNEPGQMAGFLAKIVEYLFVQINMMRSIKAEERSKTVDVMAITRNIMEIEDMCMLRYKASSARVKLEDVHTRLGRVVNEDDVSQKIYDWIKSLEEKYPDDEAMLNDDDADALEKDLQKIHQFLQSKIGA